MSEPIDVVVLMGSKNDWPVMQHAVATLREFGVSCEARVLSAHRTPAETSAYVKAADAAGTRVFIAGAGMAAHLAGAVAANTTRPVLGVPLATSDLDGLDALLATVQMPPGTPVGTLAVGQGGAINAALLAISILALDRPALEHRPEPLSTAKRQPHPIRNPRSGALIRTPSGSEGPQPRIRGNFAASAGSNPGGTCGGGNDNRGDAPCTPGESAPADF